MKISYVFKRIFLLIILVGALYGIGRLYYVFTAGFTIGNISSDLAYDPRWETHPLSLEERNQIEKVLNQEYTYLGKGCQAYVFASPDGQYVLKFFKYQRFRPQPWLNLFTFIPAIESYQQKKAIEKKGRLERVFRSWKLVYEKLKNETGVVYVHLNKTSHLNMPLVLHDKLGGTHRLDLDKMEFLVQKRAEMLCPKIESLMADHREKQASQIIDRLFSMLISEYERGYADNDHALMQNTGVLDGYPIHIDVGQFIYNDIVKDPKIYKQEIYDKMYKLRVWLEKHYPELALHLKARLIDLLGIDYYYMGPYKHKGDVAKIPWGKDEG